jgi:S-phase kinase-associated protein 1
MTLNIADVVPEWYANFVKVDRPVLFELMLAANYMDLKALVELTCATVAITFKCKTPEEICRDYNIEGSFTAEEVAQMVAENKTDDQEGASKGK